MKTMFIYYFFIFLIAWASSFILTPFIRYLSIKRGWLDKPDSRKVNKEPVPLLGGVAIYLGFFISLVFFIFQEPFLKYLDKFLGIILSCLIIVLTGIEDDLKGLSPRRKLFFQIVGALSAVMFGFLILKVSHPLGGSFKIPSFLSIAITVFWIVGLTNAMNLLDGLDGLASGVGGIIALVLFVTALKGGNYFVGSLALALVGGILGFLPYNFYPAKIFMGDTGSMCLGFLLSLISIEAAHKASIFVTLLIPIVAMGLPVVDTALSILRRLVKGENIFSPDKEHIHHRLLQEEGSQRKVVLKLYFLTFSFGLIAVSFSGMRGYWLIFSLLLTGIFTFRWVVNAGFLDFEEYIEK